MKKIEKSSAKNLNDLNIQALLIRIDQNHQEAIDLLTSLIKNHFSLLSVIRTKRTKPHSATEIHETKSSLRHKTSW